MSESIEDDYEIPRHAFSVRSAGRVPSIIDLFIEHDLQPPAAKVPEASDDAAIDRHQQIIDNHTGIAQRRHRNLVAPIMPLGPWVG